MENVKLSSQIKINASFQRSINISHDLNSVEIIQGYVCSATSINILKDLARQYATSNQSSYTWTGPFGSGKSSLAILLMSLLSKDAEVVDVIQKKLGKSVYNSICKSMMLDQNRWLAVPVVGERERPVQLLKNALESQGVYVGDDVLKSLEKFSKSQPVFIMFDEMGKVMEHAAEGFADIYFFQQLAELANRNKNIIFIGILHQSVAEYARSLPYAAREEWSKIQGRFVDYVVNAAGEEQIGLIAASLRATKQAKRIAEKSLSNKHIIVAENISKSKSINVDALSKSLSECWPLSPLTAAVLAGFSKKRFGQNQRSIFSFINSAERFGFAQFLESTNLDSDLTCYTAADFYDYLHANYDAYIISSSDSRVWALIHDCISRAVVNGFEHHEIVLLKTIGVIEMFRALTGVSATLGLLSSELGMPLDSVQIILQKMVTASMLIHRSYLDAYSLFEGSDFDIQDAIEHAVKKIDVSHGIKKLSEIMNFPVVVGKKHHYLTGAMRWMDIQLVRPSETLVDTEFDHNHIGRFIIVVPESVDKALDLEKMDSMTRCCYAQLGNHKRYNYFLTEILALEWIQLHDPRLLGDAIARREVEERLRLLVEDLKTTIEGELSVAVWFHRGRKIENIGYDNLSAQVSQIAEELFPDAPIIRSEMLNKEKPSGSANSAVSALIKGLFASRDEFKLGWCDSYPPQRGLYEIIIEPNQLHLNGEIVRPQQSSSLYTLWIKTDEMLSAKKENVDLTDIYDYWANSLGVKKGLHNILMTLYILSSESTVAVYQEGVYQIEFSELLADYLAKTPKYLALRYVGESKSNQAYLESIIKALEETNEYKTQITDVNALSVSKELVRYADSLNKWTMRTRCMSKKTMQLRDKLKTAHDPNNLLFDSIPRVFDGNVDDYPIWISQFELALKEMKEAYINLVNDFARILADGLNYSLLNSEALADIASSSKRYQGKSGDLRLDRFVMCLSDIDAGKIISLDPLMSMTINKPVSGWIDTDIDRAKLSLQELLGQYKRIQRIIDHGSNDNDLISLVIPSGEGSIKTHSIHQNTDASTRKLINKIDKTLESEVDGDVAQALLSLLIKKLNKEG